MPRTTLVQEACFTKEYQIWNTLVEWPLLSRAKLTTWTLHSISVKVHPILCNLAKLIWASTCTKERWFVITIATIDGSRRPSTLHSILSVWPYAYSIATSHVLSTWCRGEKYPQGHWHIVPCFIFLSIIFSFCISDTSL